MIVVAHSGKKSNVEVMCGESRHSVFNRLLRCNFNPVSVLLQPLSLLNTHLCSSKRGSRKKATRIQVAESLNACNFYLILNILILCFGRTTLDRFKAFRRNPISVWASQQYSQIEKVEL